jgi:hypothetical protein
MGEGLPWDIVLVFFFIGVLMGINTGKRQKKRNKQNENPNCL